jgi:CRISPR-associated endonuclease/helicase Cas3
VHVLTRPTDGQGVYDPRLVEGAIQVLHEYRGQAINEAALSLMLDAVYRDDLANEFRTVVRKQLRTFEQFCLDRLQAFDSDDRLEETFDSLFDGVEVLPSALETEFVRIANHSPLDAAGLLVPIRYGQFYGLLGQRKVRPGPETQWVVDVPYDPVLGLQLGMQRLETP